MSQRYSLVLYNPIIKVPESTLSGIDRSQSCHYCGRGPALSLPPRSLSTKLDGTWKWYWGQSCQSRYCNTHHESSCPLTIYFCIILFVCVYWCRVRSVVGRLSRNLISHKHETPRHRETKCLDHSWSPLHKQEGFCKNMYIKGKW